ncbi:hypothetical protein [Peribacillus frigoritolerans]|uniref:hypothetical protein n=1 Tax=Peribacillus frigoritolerans TaxID=450367 RepID=UPI001F0BDF73|nr:hypothetical protein [Peribacillus frigoritolerans]
MSKTKKILLTLLGVFSIILVGVVILLFSFTQSMKADPDEEKKIRDQAERYLEETFDEGTKKMMSYTTIWETGAILNTQLK